MKKDHDVRLVARNEGIEYRDQSGVYRFNVALLDKKWIVYLPGSRGAFYESHELTDEERRIVLPRIRTYLENQSFWHFIGSRYPVAFEPEGPISDATVKARLWAARYWVEEKGRANGRETNRSTNPMP